MLQQLLADAVGVGAGAVDLVNRDDDGNVRGFRVFDRLDGLRHDAVIGGDHQDHDVGHTCAAGAHGGEGLMAGGVQKSDFGAGGEFHLIGADMLGDAASLMRRDASMAERIQQAGFAVIDMAHDGDDRRARLQVGIDVFVAFQADFDVVIGDAAGFMAEFGDHQLGGVGVDRLRQGRHDAELHQGFDDFIAAGGHAVGELLDGDGLGENHFADDFQAVGAEQFELGLAALALALAADRGEAADFLVLAFQGGLDVDFAGAAAVVADFFRGDHGGAALGGGRADAADAARGVFVVLGGGTAAGFQAQGFGRGGGHRGAADRGWCSGGGGGGFGRGLGRGGFGLFGLNRFRVLFGALGLELFLVLAAAGFLGGGEDRDFFLLAAFGLADRGDPLLFGEHALAGGDFGGGERAWRRAAGRGACRADAGGAHRGGGGGGFGGEFVEGRRGLGFGAGRQREGGGLLGRGGTWDAAGGQAALFADFDLHDLGTAVRKTLPHGTGVDSMAGIAARHRAER